RFGFDYAHHPDRLTVPLIRKSGVPKEVRPYGVDWRDTFREATWDEALDRGALNAAGQLVGLAQRMLDLSVDYASQRRQFGKPIGSFQAVKHHLAEVATRIEFAKPVLYRAAAALASGDPLASALVSHAKLVCGDAAWQAGRKGIQVHGAMGYTWEVDLQMFMKRAWVLDAAWGDRAFHKSRLADALFNPTAPLGPAATWPC
ncbi:MAG: acyl-CoA dehydrogenase family protein, partial [Rubrivivax sp.]